MSSYFHTNEQRYFLHACYPQRRSPSSRETSSVGFNSPVIAGSVYERTKKSTRRKYFPWHAQPISFLSFLPLFPHDLLISLDGTPAIPCENTILLESLVSGVRACARVLSELESRGQTLSARPKSCTELSFWTGIYEREPRRRSSTKCRDVSD